MCKCFFHSILVFGAIISSNSPLPLLLISLLILESPLNGLFMIIGGSQSFVHFIYSFIFLFLRRDHLKCLFFKFTAFSSFGYNLLLSTSSEIFISFILLTLEFLFF